MLNTRINDAIHNNSFTPCFNFFNPLLLLCVLHGVISLTMQNNKLHGCNGRSVGNDFSRRQDATSLCLRMSICTANI